MSVSVNNSNNNHTAAKAIAGAATLGGAVYMAKTGKLGQIKQLVADKVDITAIRNKVKTEGLKTVISEKFGQIKSKITSPEFKQTVSEKLGGWKDKIVEWGQQALEFVKDIPSKVSGKIAK